MLEEVTEIRNTILQIFFLFVYCSEFPFHPNYPVMITGDQNASHSNEIRELEELCFLPTPHCPQSTGARPAAVLGPTKC